MELFPIFINLNLPQLNQKYLFKIIKTHNIEMNDASLLVSSEILKVFVYDSLF